MAQVTDSRINELIKVAPEGTVLDPNKTSGADLRTLFKELRDSILENTPANTPPVAEAGSNKTITLPTSSVQLTGSATDSDGTIATYLWEFVSGPNTPTFSATNVAQPTVSNLSAPGTYQFRLTVTDDDGATHQDTMQVTVNKQTSTAPSISTEPNYDTLNRFSVTHNYTDAEIEVSVNNNVSAMPLLSAMAEYDTATDMFTVGDNARAAGYWRFRVKETATRSASGWASSPVFTKEPTYNATLSPGGSQEGVTLTAMPGVQFKFNVPQPAGDPFPATMLLYAGSTQIGQVDFNMPYAGQPCAIVYEGNTYHKTFVNGNLNILA